MNKNEQILKSRAAEYGSYADNVVLYNKYWRDLAIKYITERGIPSLVMRRLEEARSLTSSMLALKLARIKPSMSDEVTEDTVRDFFNYMYLFLDYTFGFHECTDLKVEFISDKVIDDATEDSLIKSIFLLIHSKDFNRANYKLLLGYADIVLEEPTYALQYLRFSNEPLR